MMQHDVSLKSRNTLGLAVRAAHFMAVSSENDVEEVIRFAREHDQEILVLGEGSNIVFAGDFDGLVVHPGFRCFDVDASKLTIGAGENWHSVVQRSLEAGLFGLENLSLIPGLAGAAPIQNIGAYGQDLDQVFDHLVAIDLQSGEIRRFDKSECQFGYRDSVFKNALKNRYLIKTITLNLDRTFRPRLDFVDLAHLFAGKSPTASEVSRAVIEIRKRKIPNPDDVGNVGSFFKNPVISAETFAAFSEKPTFHQQQDGLKIPAAWLIEKVGMKGKVYGGAAISEQHALVLTNNDNATPQDVLNLKAEVEQAVKARFGIQLEMEPELV